MKSILLLLAIFMLVACEQTTTEDDPSPEEGFSGGNPVVISNGSNPDDGSGGATESWGIITYERTFPPYFEQFANSNKANLYRLEFFTNDDRPGSQLLEIGELEVYQKVKLEQHAEMDMKSSRLILQTTNYQKLDYTSAWDELEDGDLLTLGVDNMTKYNPGVIDFEFDSPVQVDMIKVSFHLTNTTKELPHRMILKKRDPSLGWVKVYEVTNLNDERFEDLKLDQLTTFKITEGPDCQQPLFLSNHNECVPNRIICSDLANAFKNTDFIPCEVLYNDSVVDCIAAGSDVNCNDSISANLCQEYSLHHGGSGTFKVRTKMETVIRTQTCND